MKKRDLKVPRGFDPRTQKQVGLFMAQLDDQLKRLKNNAKGLSVKQLEWQPRAGMNSIGMLLAHLALVEFWWIKVAPTETRWEPEGKKLIKKFCGFEDDGLPLSPRGKHCKHLSGYSLARYLKVMDAVRRTVRRELKTWRDRDLPKTYRLGKSEFSRMWTVYHVLEHFAAHFGQMLLLQHMMRDAGVLKAKKK